MKRDGIVIGIDAANLRDGGGITHLVELIRAADPHLEGVRRVVLWGAPRTLALVDDRQWLIKRSPGSLDGGLIRRAYWQKFVLSREAREAHCDVLLIPGGSFAGDFAPVVTMSRNMLPFESVEIKRYGFSPFAVKLVLLRTVQSRSFRRSEGVVFLTEYARDAICRITGKPFGDIAIIPHGINSRFFISPRSQREIATYAKDQPFRILYVSSIDEYKHQWNVVEAVATLRRAGVPVVLDLVGGARPKSLARLLHVVRKEDPEGRFVFLHGPLPFDKLHKVYESADIGLFASSCENMPNILLEMMAAGLPIACSNRGPMPEILGCAGVYFDPLSQSDINRAITVLIGSAEIRETLSRLSFSSAQKYSWIDCAARTFSFLVGVAQAHGRKSAIS